MIMRAPGAHVRLVQIKVFYVPYQPPDLLPNSIGLVAVLTVSPAFFLNDMASVESLLNASFIG